MLTPQEWYPLVLDWLRALAAPAHPLATAALTHLVVALLSAQSLRPSALRRALLSRLPVPARQRDKRLARAWDRPWLSPAWLTGPLVRAATALVPPEGEGPTAGLTHLALDSLRCGPWEVCTLALAEPSGALHDWLVATLREGAQRLTDAARAQPPQPAAQRAA
jgi:hypothetical protein